MASLLDAVAWGLLPLANSIPKVQTACILGAERPRNNHNVDADRSHGKRPGSPPSGSRVSCDVRRIRCRTSHSGPRSRQSPLPDTTLYTRPSRLRPAEDGRAWALAVDLSKHWTWRQRDAASSLNRAQGDWIDEGGAGYSSEKGIHLMGPYHDCHGSQCIGLQCKI